MKALALWQWNSLAWLIFLAYWAISSLHVKRTKTSESSLNRLGTIAFMVLAYTLLFTNRIELPWLQQRFIPNADWIAVLGIFVTFTGVAIAIWARYTLGEYWSAMVTLKEDHRLISNGPYAYVRHPIYTGLLLATLGTALMVGEWRGIVTVLLVLIAHTQKAKREEALLGKEFGSQYEDYRHRTGFLFPRLWNSAS